VENKIWTPLLSDNLARADISSTYLQEFLLKATYILGALSGKDFANLFKIPFNFIEDELVKLKQNELLAITGNLAGVSGYHAMQFEITSKGRERVKDIVQIRPYIGPMPVTIDQYLESVNEQRLKTRQVNYKNIKDIFSDMVLGQHYLNTLGPAINSGGPIFIHGKPGNGKTMISEKLIKVFNDEIYVPYCILVDGQVIRFFDEKVHKMVPANADKIDQRWIRIKRPFIVVGGELTLSLLDLIYKDEFKYYEAPFQLKANGGVLLIDDFGRQMVSPRDLLNRWIYPLEKGVDYLTLATGKKIEVPFTQLLIFSTNLNPTDLGDDAFWRRIKYKIEILGPTQEEFKTIFTNQCTKLSIEFDEEAFNYLIDKYYKTAKRDFRGCHPRDILNHINDFIHFYKQQSKITKSAIDFACRSYFVNKN